MKRSTALEAYDRLLGLLPRAFRLRHEDEMRMVFAETLQDLRGAPLGRARAWGGALIDLLRWSLVERLRTHRGQVLRGPAVSYGNTHQLQRKARHVIESLLSDIRFALRSFRKSPGFSSVAILTIGLGIGATTLVFSVVYGVLLRPLPYEESARLVNVWNDLIEERQFLPAVHPEDFRDYQRMSRTFDEFAAASGNGQVGLSGVLTGDGPPQHIALSSVTHNFFSLLGVDPVLGRHFTEDEEAFGGPSVLVMSHALWRTRYGADSAIVGRSIQLDGRPFTVVGVLPRGFRLLLPSEAFLVEHSDIWVPLQIDYSNLPPRNWTYFTVLGRLDDGITLAQAQAEMDGIAEELRATYPAHAGSGMQIRLVPFQHDIVKEAGTALWILFGAVGFVLLIACANVAHLLLLRGASRQREIALRTALGARRTRVVRQVLTESALLGVLGAVLGLVLTRGGLALLAALEPPNLPRVDELGMSGTVMAFALLAAGLTAVAFGLAPALHASKSDVSGLLHEGGRSGRSAGAGRLRNVLIVGEVAFSLVLLVGTGLMIRSFQHLQRVRPGFDAEGVLTFSLSLARTAYPGGAEITNFHRELYDRLAAIPGIDAVGAISQLPLTGSGPLWPYAYDDETLSHFNLSADGRNVGGAYFEAMGVRLIAGRYFDERDNRESAPVVIVEEMLARRAWPDDDPIGKQLHLSRNATATVVGVVEHTRVYDLTRDVREHVYVPHRQRGARSMNLVVKTAGDAAALAPMVRDAVWSIDPDLPVDRLRPMTHYVADATAPTRFSLLVMSGFGLLALILASVGIYGVISYAVDQRRHEFGVRIALGAHPNGIIRSVVAGGARLLLGSLAVGVIVAAALTRSMTSLLVGVSPRDVLTYVVVSAVLFAVAMLACYLPARRIAGADPLEALRAD